MVLHVLQRIALSALLCWNGGSRSMVLWQDRGPTAVAENVRERSLDELISLLPRNSDYRWDANKRRVVMDPIAAELRSRLDSGAQLSGDQWRAALLRSGAIRWRALWPESHPFALSMRCPAWLGRSVIRVIPRNGCVRQPRAGSLAWSMCGNAVLMMEEIERYQPFLDLSVGKHDLQVDVTIESREPFAPSWEVSGSDTDPPLIWKGPLSIKTTIVPILPEAIPPISSAELDLAVASSMRLAFSMRQTEGGSGEGKAMLICDPDTLEHPALATTALSLYIDIRNGSKVVETLHFTAGCRGKVIHVADERRNRRLAIVSSAIRSVPADFDTLESASEWSLRIRGTEQGVLSLWNADSWWCGDIIIPLKSVRERELKRFQGYSRESSGSRPSAR